MKTNLTKINYKMIEFTYKQSINGLRILNRRSDQPEWLNNSAERFLNYSNNNDSIIGPFRIGSGENELQIQMIIYLEE
jgi:hypothetical protein